MKKLIDWTQDELSGKKLIYYVLGFVAIYFVYSVLTTYIITYFYPDFLTSKEHFVNSLTNQIKNFGWYLLPIIYIVVVIEELLFRFLPLIIAIKLYRLYGAKSIILVVALVSSLLFGYIHGGWIFVPIQGVLGLLACIIFLKAGGFQQKYFKAYVACIILHVIINTVAIVPSILEYSCLLLN